MISSRTLLLAGLLVAMVGGLARGQSADANDECGLAAAYILDRTGKLEFGISIDRCVDHWKLEFEEFAGRDDEGGPIWIVLELLEISRESPDEVIVYQACSIGGVEDEGIVVVAQETAEDWYSTIRIAWRADRQRGRWIPVDPSTVRCWNEAAGL